MGTDGVRAAGAGLMRRISLLAILVALLVQTATTATTTAPARSDAVATAAALQQTVEVGAPSTDSPCDALERDGSDTVVRVIKKVRGVFLPHGLVPPTFAPADTPTRHEVSPRSLPAPRAAVSPRTYPQRGPPTNGVHPSP